MTGFRILHGQGFQMTLANGWTVSVQFGPGTLTTNVDLGIEYDYRAYPSAFSGGDWVSGDAEIAAFYRDPDDASEELRWYRFGGPFADGALDDHCAPEDVIAWLAKMAALPKVGTDWVRVDLPPTTIDKEGIAAQDHLPGDQDPLYYNAGHMDSGQLTITRNY